MAWLSRNNIAPTDSLTADMLNSLANDIRYWGGDVNGGGYRLSNVVMSGTGGFERIPSPAIIAPVVMDGLAQIQFVDFVAGVPDPTYPPRWTLTKKALPTPDFAIDRFSAGGSFLDEPFMIRAVDGVIVMKAQEWTGPVNGGGQTITNVVLGPSVIAGAQTPWKQNINAAKFALTNARGIYTENVATGVPYSSAGLIIYEALMGGLQTANESPRIAFYHQGRDASQIGYEAFGAGIRTWTAAGTGYAPFDAAVITGAASTATADFSGAGIHVREPGRTNSGSTIPNAPRIAFWWGGTGVTQIGSDPANATSIRTYNQAGDGYAAFTCRDLRLQTSWAVNLDYNGKHTLAGPAVMFYCEPGGGGSAFMAFAPTNAAGSSVSWHSFPLNISTGAFRIGAIQIGKVQIDSGYFYPQKMVQYDWAYHAWNMEESTGQWRLMEAGYGNVITSSLGDGNLRIYTSLSGAAGGVASLVPTAAFGPTQITFIATQVNQRELSAGASATYVFQSAAAQSRWQVGMGGSPGNYVISRFDVNGNYIDNPLSISQATGDTSFNNHQITTIARVALNYVVDAAFPSVQLFNTGALSTFGVGIEANAIYYITGLNSLHRWYHGTADGGATDLMELASNKLTINVPTDMKGNLDMGGFTISNIGGAGAGFVTTFNTRTGAVVSVLGDYPPAKLGTGTPDNTKYLRGDGTWQVPPGSAGGEPQTPWTRNIEGAGDSLLNAGMGDFAATTVAADQPGIVIRQPLRQAGLPTGQTDIASMPRLMFHWVGVAHAQIGMVADGTIRTFNGPGTGYAPFYAGFGEFAAYSPGLGYGGTTGLIIREAARANLITPEYAPRITFWWGGLGATQIGSDPLSYLGIRTYNSDGTDFAYFSSGSMRFQDNIAMNVDISGKCTRNAQPALLIQADNVNGGQVYFGFAANGTKGAAVSYHSFPINITTANFLLGAPQIPKVTISSRYLYTQQIQTPLDYVHAWNVDEGTGTWRYVANGGAFHMYLDSSSVFHMKVAPVGTAGGVPGYWIDAMTMYTTGVNVNVPLNLLAGGRAAMLQGVNELDIDFYITNAGTNVKRSRIMAYSSGYIALNTLDDAYTMITSRLELYNNKVNSDQPICVTGGAIYAPNLNGLHLAFDGASGMVAAINNPTAWKALYLRGLNVNVEAQGGTLSFGGTASFNSSITQTLPSSQTDPGNFGGMSGAHYVYFDPATKKLVLRYHEGGVAFRNYILKEGDQGTGLAIVNDPSSQSQVLAVYPTIYAIRDSFQVPAGTNMVRVQLRITVTGTITVYLGLCSAAVAKGSNVPAGGSDLLQVSLGNLVATAASPIDIDVGLVAQGTKTSISAQVSVGGGAWQGSFSTADSTKALVGNHIAVGMVSSPAGVTATSVNFVGTKMY
jgi:hypothetical protein